MTTADHKKLLKTLLENVKFPCSYDDTATAIYDANGKQLIDIRGWGWISVTRIYQQFTGKT